VIIAACLASKAAADEITVSEKAFAKAGFDGKDLESRRLELKGITEPVTVRVVRGNIYHAIYLRWPRQEKSIWQIDKQSPDPG
jgi:class 3 adenylate cyclase